MQDGNGLGSGDLLWRRNGVSGSLNASAAELAFTERLSAALALIDVRLLDHFVVTATAAVSIMPRGG